MGAAVTFSWPRVAELLRELITDDAQKPQGQQHLDEGQRASLAWMAHRLPLHGAVLADEVGTGKTRIACAVVQAVVEAGGRAAVVVPHGLMHQWTAEARKLRTNSPAPKELSTFTDYLRNLSTSDAAQADIGPRPSEPEWWLISHGFRAPIVRSNSYVWRAALPALVELNLASRAERQDGRTRIGKLHRDVENARASWWGCNGMARVASEIAPRIRGRRDLRARMENLPLPSLSVSTWNNDALLAQFGSDGDGLKLTEELLGLWLGNFDLIVIDEAHKSRGEADSSNARAASTKVLARLVDALLKQSENSRRLCLTATPMELELTQWLDLLKRARCGIDLETAGRVVQRLHRAAEGAAVAPDETARLDELCAAARDFRSTLAPYVTRRRRDDDPLIGLFRAQSSLPAGLPHPHRRIQAVQIDWTATAEQRSPWLDVLFAAECMSHSARGLKLKDTESWPRAVRDAYTKLSAGHVSIDLSEVDESLRVPEAGTVDDHTRAKIARTAYWYRRLREGHKAVVERLSSADGVLSDPDAEHPRIIAAVREIESWTTRPGQPEKVLVFGVFLRPLQLLADVLNVRCALRAADQGRPSPLNFFPRKRYDSTGDQSARAQHLLGIATQQVTRMRAEGALLANLAAGSDLDMRRALSSSHKAYEQLQRHARVHAKNPVQTWHEDPKLLKGISLDKELSRVLEDHLVSFVLDEMLASASAAEQLTEERFGKLAAEFVEHRLRPLLGEPGAEDNDDERNGRKQEALKVLLDDEESRRSPHARLLQGSTRWETRRYLQAAFNRPGTSPSVLIAQSQVGREGLNLHEACRVVVQFHAEWNPAVLEQQIGRVDRKGSLWEQRATQWLAGAPGEAPFIEVRQLVFEGTYDAFQWARVGSRKRVFDASLFGALLSAEALARVPEDRVQQVLEAAPTFAPPRLTL